MASMNGNGSLIQLETYKPRLACRKWRLVVSLGSDPATGKRRRKSRVFNGSWSQAHEALREFAKEAKAGR